MNIMFTIVCILICVRFVPQSARSALAQSKSPFMRLFVYLFFSSTGYIAFLYILLQLHFAASLFTTLQLNHSLINILRVLLFSLNLGSYLILSSFNPEFAENRSTGDVHSLTNSCQTCNNVNYPFIFHSKVSNKCVEGFVTDSYISGTSIGQGNSFKYLLFNFCSLISSLTEFVCQKRAITVDFVFNQFSAFCVQIYQFISVISSARNILRTLACLTQKRPVFSAQELNTALNQLKAKEAFLIKRQNGNVTQHSKNALKAICKELENNKDKIIKIMNEVEWEEEAEILTYEEAKGAFRELKADYTEKWDRKW
ncbi:Hypothetical_protein [Hexamita inflata]|uniref:Hypothetical_protein n=1 Tax=Hexamita inflata TaxID=28002 RepID=A0AA86NEG1_9EUKA|nr:Hypothetical protein HINF_LOCUS5952 [Hexamita inflata]